MDYESIDIERSGVAERYSTEQVDAYVRSLHTHKADRPTVVLIVQDSEGRYAIARHNTDERNWGPPQGGIKPGESFIDAGYRELLFEAGIMPDRVAMDTGCLHVGKVARSGRPQREPYVGDTYYVCMGIRLHPGSVIRLEPSGTRRQELLEWLWLPYQDACRYCIEQPGAMLRLDSTVRHKAEDILLPALSTMHLSFL